jgi:putative dimethyl sulfoxide reductase chaperone
MLHLDQRRELYRQLATLFFYPGEDLLALLGDDERWSAAAGHFGVSLPEEVAATSLGSLQEAYTALFDTGLGGAVAPPYGSVYLDPAGMLMGSSTLQVAACYAESGLRLEETVEPADFLPTELEFLYFLVDREARALKMGDLATARDLTARQGRFLEAWLLPWLPAFLARLEARPLHPLYPWAAKLLLAFCRAELDWLKRLNNAGG